MIRKKIKYLRMRHKVKKAFAPYYKGKKSFLECQIDALVGLLGKPLEKIN